MIKISINNHISSVIDELNKRLDFYSSCEGYEDELEAIYSFYDWYVKNHEVEKVGFNGFLRKKIFDIKRNKK